jgi:hypothetical protein
MAVSVGSMLIREGSVGLELGLGSEALILVGV